LREKKKLKRHFCTQFEGDQMIFFKKSRPNRILSKLLGVGTADFEEQVAQNVIQKYDFEKNAQVNNLSMGENSHYLVTLLSF
jgi:hypothetical protein